MSSSTASSTRRSRGAGARPRRQNPEWGQGVEAGIQPTQWRPRLQPPAPDGWFPSRRSFNNLPQPNAAIYYGQRASEGGLMIAEATSISERGYGCAGGAVEAAAGT